MNAQIRPISERDLPALVGLLHRGFPRRSRAYWERGLARLEDRPVPDGIPRYGHLLEADGEPVGVVLSIPSVRRVGGREVVYLNLSSWYVEPAHRHHSLFLLMRALKRKEATYLDVSPAVKVIPIIEALGFKRYVNGQYLAIPAAARARAPRGTTVLGLNRLERAGLDASELDLLRSHARYGCISFCCVSSGSAHPFVFVPRRVKGALPVAQLVYCRKLDDVVSFAREIGRHLLRFGQVSVLLDATGPLEGLPGKYFAGKAPKYYKGKHPPRIGDVAYTEIPLLGI